MRSTAQIYETSARKLVSILSPFPPLYPPPPTLGLRAPTNVADLPVSDLQSSSLISLENLGLFAIRAERDYVTQEDFMKAVRKIGDQKKLEGKLDYKASWKNES